MASGKWQVASGKWQVLQRKDERLKVDDTVHQEEQQDESVGGESWIVRELRIVQYLVVQYRIPYLQVYTSTNVRLVVEAKSRNPWHP